jgi:acetyl esterase/lipase
MFNGFKVWFIGATQKYLFNPYIPVWFMRMAFDFLCGFSHKKIRTQWGLKVSTTIINDIKVDKIESKGSDITVKVILYIHGGGYFMGSPYCYGWYLAYLAKKTGYTVYCPTYRLAPEHPFPAAQDDVYRVCLELAKIHPETKVVLIGDSAGGGLVTSLLLRLRDEGQPLPDKAVAISPWLDLTGSQESINSNHRKDLWLDRWRIDHWAPFYAASSKLREPYVSPFFGRAKGLPPTLMVAGGSEVLLDDARVFCQRAQETNKEVLFHLGKGMQHNWPITSPRLPESKRANAKILDFIRN